MGIDLKVKYAVDQSEFIPILSTSYITGMHSGFTREFTSMSTENYRRGEKVEFVAEGVLNWEIFGIKMYGEPKTFKGFIGFE